MRFIVQHTVRHYDTWKPAVDEHESVRAEYRCRGHTIYREADEPNNVMDYGSRERADEFMRYQGLKSAEAPPATARVGGGAFASRPPARLGSRTLFLGKWVR